MRTVKLVIIGASGVGKSSIRNQYISGRFTTGYRATIGADFITKSLPHYSSRDELVTLQIWDTAGQERFSSLSSAFFRGADAVILMFDVNQPQTLDALTKWWDDFRDKAPVPDETLDEFCCVVVGNKVDIAAGERAEGACEPVTEAEARDFIHTLVPHPSTPPRPRSMSSRQTWPTTTKTPPFLYPSLCTPPTPPRQAQSTSARPSDAAGRRVRPGPGAAQRSSAEAARERSGR
ncbi:P-loop containing nucleoside triphosphate hydrolase protein [Daedaleopsis nitida]|nr:P-loop containing nucleoside triphosphate hydrolase protein [Daedaleopsis nitida]